MSKINYNRQQLATVINQRKLINRKWKICCAVLALLCIKCPLYANIEENNVPAEYKIVYENNNSNKNLKEISVEKDPLIRNQKRLIQKTSEQSRKQLALKAAYNKASINSEKRIQELEMENYLLRSDLYKLSKLVIHSINSLHSLYYNLKATDIDKVQSKLNKIINKLDNGFDAHFQEYFEKGKKTFSSKKKDTGENK